MLNMLRDLYRYQAWADHEILRAIAACPAAAEDARVRERLQHAHAVQRAFFSVFRRETPDVEAVLKPFDSLDELHRSVRRYHRDVAAFLADTTDGDIAGAVVVPWFSDAEFMLGEAMLQVVLHSQHHRGQSATALRDLGGEPPLMDFIGWVAEGRPAMPAEGE
jgi:uncharacterized damage-inducible protein DinB